MKEAHLPNDIEYNYAKVVCQLYRRNEMTEFDKINHPRHYNSHPSGVEAITITRHHSFNIGNAIKYLWRCDFKDGLDDLRKAAWYVNDEIKCREEAIKNQTELFADHQPVIKEEVK